MEVQENGRWAKSHALGLPKHRGDEHLRAHNWLPRHRMVLADPELVIAKFLGAQCQFHVLVVALGQWFLRRVEWHDKDATLYVLQWNPRIYSHAQRV